MRNVDADVSRCITNPRNREGYRGAKSCLRVDDNACFAAEALNRGHCICRWLYRKALDGNRRGCYWSQDGRSAGDYDWDLG